MSFPPRSDRRGPASGAAAAMLAVALSGCMLIPHPGERGASALEQGHVLLGAWLGEWPSQPAIERFERETGVRLDLVDTYVDWTTPFEEVRPSLEQVAAAGAIPLVTWEPHGLSAAEVAAGDRGLQLRDGRRLSADDYLAEFASGLCALADGTGQPVLLRTLQEGNGDWYSWSAGASPDRAQDLRRAWVHVHAAFSARCPGDVLFVWAVSHANAPGADYGTAYPGDRYVDFVGIDGYNRGSHSSWGWQPFDYVFRSAYCAMTAVSDRPVLLTEVGSAEQGGDKARWIREMYARLDTYGRIQGIVWLDGPTAGSGSQGEWSVDSSPDALKAFKTGASQILDRRLDGPAPSRPDMAC